jgi:hypothetical protein
VQADADFVANVKLALSLLGARRECTSFAVGSEAVNGSGGTLSAQQKSATAIYLGSGVTLSPEFDECLSVSGYFAVRKTLVEYGEYYCKPKGARIARRPAPKFES